MTLVPSLARIAGIAASLTLIWSLPAPAVERDSVEPVRVRGVVLQPRANLVYAAGRLELHPKAAALLGYDSNVYQMGDDEVDDTYGVAMAGIQARYIASALARLRADLEIEGYDYHEEDERDRLGVRGRLAYRRATDYHRLDIALAYLREEEPSREEERSVLRQDFSTDLGVRHHGRSLAIAWGGGVLWRDYLEGGDDFDQDERDRLAANVYIGLIRVLGEEREADVRITGLVVDYREDGRYQDSYGLRLTAGYTTSVARRSQASIRAGLEVREYRRSAVYDADTVVAPVVDGALRWRYRERSNLAAGVSVGLQDGGVRESEGFADVDLTWRHHLPRRFVLGADLGTIARHEMEGDDPERTNVYRAGARLGYRPLLGIGVDGTVAWRQVEGTGVGDDYDQVRATIELTAAF